MLETRYCPRHRTTQTNLRCGRCDELICPRCLVHTPVGARCVDCARPKRLPTFDVTGIYLARAIAASGILGIVGGSAIAFLSVFLFRVPFLELAALVGMGFGIGEGTSLAVNRKRGRVLRFVSGGGVLVAYITISALSSAFGTFNPVFVRGLLFGLVALGISIYLAVSRF